MKRLKVEPKADRGTEEEGGGLYFKKPTTSLRFVQSGSTLLDCVNSGGAAGSWALGRMSNIIGDKSTGKTLLAIEAFANFRKSFPKGKMFYRESEAAFEQSYADSIGMPVDAINFGAKGKRWRLIEEVFEDIKAQTAICKDRKVPALYVIDSLDALTTQIDLDRDFGAQTYRTDKPSQMGELFRKCVADIEESDMALVIISQVRVNIGATFGDKTTRSGGKAMDFYATTINKFAHLKQNSETRQGQKRVTSIRVRGRNIKSKSTDPFRECEFNIRFGYGINDLASCMEWLIAAKRYGDLDKSLTKDTSEKLLGFLQDLDESACAEWGDVIREKTVSVWQDIENQFKPKVRKYA